MRILTQIILGLISIILLIWTIVEFLIYLVKDIPFNWWSLGSFIIVILILIGISYVKLLNDKRNAQKRLDELVNRHAKKSNFAIRLENELKKRQNEK